MGTRSDDTHTWWSTFLEDVDAAVDRDPAATSRLEVALASPGLHAITPTWASSAGGRVMNRPTRARQSRCSSGESHGTSWPGVVRLVSRLTRTLYRTS